MVAALVPYRWTDCGGGYMAWSLPAGVTSAIDLRPLALLPDTNSIGYAVAMLDGTLPEGSVELETGNETRDRDAWGSALGFRPTGSNVAEWTRSQLLDGADDTGDAACRPLRGPRDKVELWLGGRHEFDVSYTERLRQQVYTRNDLERLMDDVEAERLPLVMVRKALQACADQHGIDANTLKRKTARWRGVTPANPETTITDGFRDNATFIFLAAYGWSMAGENANRFGTGNNGVDGLGSKLYFDGGGGVTGIGIGNASNYGWHPTSLSLSDNTAILEGVGRNGGQPALGPLCRGNGTTSGYTCDNSDAALVRAFSLVANVGASLGTGARSTQTRDDLRAWASSSTIRFSDQATGAAIITVTNTALTVGLRVGVHGYSGGGENNAQGFSARDFLTPTVSGISPSSGSTAGGTSVTITGTGFESNATVTIGGASATGVTVVSETSITATTPAGTAGAKDVVGTNPDSGFSGTLSSGFTYVTTTTTTTTTTTLAASRPTIGGRGFGSPYIGGYRPGFMRKD